MRLYRPALFFQRLFDVLEYGLPGPADPFFQLPRGTVLDIGDAAPSGYCFDDVVKLYMI
ncbi:hypothetical protein [Oscillibacter sp.]|uniref:hypothetical protein n=1 Tax=Oscillibacter sp. TaxID=1945593 RepID=UPI00272A135D|nr:hypothetical protein [Oscillibacter sp.]